MGNDDDYALALALSLQLNSVEESETTPGIKAKPTLANRRSIVDPELELLDPNPNLHQLFIDFNRTFFWGKLDMVEVRWSPRMTLCAGVCSYEGKGRLCSIRLSKPLLMLRTRKDMVETLLHEMIHAYLFVTDNNTDHDGHGPQFCSHMRRINNSAGTNITIYHSFHDEVDEMRKHWWRCTGACRSRPPYFGFVKRAMNRKPSPKDFWWSTHQASCDGVFEKVKEPENYGKKKEKQKKEITTSSQSTSKSSKSMLKFLTQNNESATTSSSSQPPGKTKLEQKTTDDSVLPSTVHIPNKRGIPLSSRIFDKFKTAASDWEPKKTPDVKNKKLPAKKLTPLDEVCRHVRMTGELSVNNGAPAFTASGVITKFLTRKEKRQRVKFCSDEESETSSARATPVAEPPRKQGLKRKSEESLDYDVNVKRVPGANFTDSLPSLTRPGSTRFSASGHRKISESEKRPPNEKLKTPVAASQLFPTLTRGGDADSSSSDSEDDVTLLEVLSPKGASDAAPQMCNCPICNKRVPVDNVNTHIDLCLNENALSEMVM